VGTLYLKVVDSPSIKALYKVMTERDQENVRKASKESGHEAAMMSHAVENTKMHLAGALSFYEALYKELGQLTPCLMKVLPLLQNPKDAREVTLTLTLILTLTLTLTLPLTPTLTLTVTLTLILTLTLGPFNSH
jgi:hypothetical protein